MKYSSIKKAIYALIVGSLVFMNSGCAALNTLLQAGLAAGAAYGLYKTFKK